jgi:hypothetical protein
MVAAYSNEAANRTMTGRRRYPRLQTTNTDGVIRMTTDVVIQDCADTEVVVLSHSAFSLGERLRIEIVATKVGRMAEVAESRPVMVDGSVHHRLRLTFVD